MTELFINGAGCISPQQTFDNSVFLPELKAYSTNRMNCVDAGYAQFFDFATLRRMSRVIKFSVAEAFIAMRDADIKVPGAISIGTGFGLLENSGKFLKDVIDQNEAVVSPTSFIQSTHNTVGGVIALMTGCYAHNNTFSNKGFSFETALIDARMVMEESGVNNFLVGGFDELTEYSLAIMARMGILQAEPCSNLSLFADKAKGIIVGEGAAFFVLSKERSDNSYCRLTDNTIFFKPVGIEEIKEKITAFLRKNNLSVNEIDVVLSGVCGDAERDKTTAALNQDFFKASTIAAFKHLSGEYMTASSFAFWLAAKILKTGQMPQGVVIENRNREPKHILIYNAYKDNHTLTLLRSC